MSKKKHKKQHHKTHHKKKDEEEKLIEEGLNAIYGDEEEVDFTKMDRGRSRLTSILLTIVVTLAVIAGVAWGAFFIYNTYFTTPEADVFSLEIDVDEEIVSGERTQIAINYANPNTVQIAALELDVRLPDTFIIADLSPSPSNEEDLIWSIGNLGPGADGIIVIDGIWIAEAPSSTPVQVFANFRPANFNADFQNIETSYIQTLDSTFAIEFSGPSDATPGEELDYEIKLTNSSSEAIENVDFELTIPDGFFLEDSTPEIDAGAETTWNFSSIEPDAEEIITFSGTFAADAEGFQYFDMVLGVMSGDRLLKQTIDQGFTDVLGSDLTLQLIANGSTEDVSTGIGEQLRVTLAYENTGDATIDPFSLLLDFQSDESLPIAWNDAELDGGRITADGILWDELIIGTLEPGDRTLLNLLFPVDAVGSGQADAFTLVARADQATLEVKSTPIAVVINSEAELTASARYFTDDGAPLGNGPLPPKVGETTSYRIYWKVHNSLHDLENVTVTATLPPNVAWEGQAAAELGSVTHDATTNTVTWNITNLPTTIDKVQSNFTVSLTPDADDVGVFVKLISDSLLSATDFETEALLEGSAESLTTELIGDDFAENKGTVVE